MTEEICLKILHKYKRMWGRDELAKKADRSMGAIDRAMLCLIREKKAKRRMDRTKVNNKIAFRVYYYI